MQDVKDTILTIGNSQLQHGKHSDRVYLMSLDPDDMPDIAEYAMKMALEQEYSKIFAKVPETQQQAFVERGFVTEAEIPRFYRGEEKCLFMSKYLDPLREMAADKEGCREVLELVQKKAGQPFLLKEMSNSWQIQKLDALNARHAAGIYRLVFASYPFPIHEEKYILQTMRENVAYFGIFHEIGLVALSSAEMDPDQQYAEMTDFATLPDYRGQHLALHLLQRMEREVVKQNIKTAYTIARAFSVGMNLTFARCGYEFAGTLYCNTNIGGAIESMNVWYKHLTD